MAKTTFNAKIIHIGNSAGIVVPKSDMSKAGVTIGDNVDVTIENKTTKRRCPTCGRVMEDSE